MNSKGFSLVEVLIAAVILFSALAVTADLFKASSFSSEKVTQKAFYFQLTPLALANIKHQIKVLSSQEKQENYAGTFEQAGIRYEWSAVRLSFKSRVQYIDESFEPAPQFGLYDVEVRPYKTAQNIKPFSFKVATW
ncbi:type IV pilus modification PilV family protein [Colwellia sp. MEBiC06753]